MPATNPPRHQCAALGCRRQVADHFVFCRRCWDWVPRELQIALYATYSRRGRQSRRFVALVRQARSELAPHFAQIDLFQQVG